MNSRNRVIRHWICGYTIFKPHVWHVRWSKEGRSTGITLIPFFFRGSLIPNIFSGQWKRFSTLLSVPVPYVIWLFTWIGLSHNSTLLSWATGFELRDKIPEIEVNFHQSFISNLRKVLYHLIYLLELIRVHEFSNTG